MTPETRGVQRAMRNAPFDVSQLGLRVFADRNPPQICPYLPRPLVEDRLDACFGVGGWSLHIRPVAGNNATIVKLTALGVSREAIAEKSGIYGDDALAFKRAARGFGIGRYLTRLPVIANVPIGTGTTDVHHFAGRHIMPAALEVKVRNHLAKISKERIDPVYGPPLTNPESYEANRSLMAAEPVEQPLEQLAGELARPYAPSAIEFVVLGSRSHVTVTDHGPTLQDLAVISPRVPRATIEDRLDHVLGSERWSYELRAADNHIVGQLTIDSITMTARGEGPTRRIQDDAAFRRCAERFAIGRYLSTGCGELLQTEVPISSPHLSGKPGAGQEISSELIALLRAEYEASLAARFAHLGDPIDHHDHPDQLGDRTEDPTAGAKTTVGGAPLTNASPDPGSRPQGRRYGVPKPPQQPDPIAPATARRPLRTARDPERAARRLTHKSGAGPSDCDRIAASMYCLGIGRGGIDRIYTAATGDSDTFDRTKLTSGVCDDMLMILAGLPASGEHPETSDILQFDTDLAAAVKAISDPEQQRSNALQQLQEFSGVVPAVAGLIAHNDPARAIGEHEMTVETLQVVDALLNRNADRDPNTIQGLLDDIAGAPEPQRLTQFLSALT